MSDYIYPDYTGTRAYVQHSVMHGTDVRTGERVEHSPGWFPACPVCGWAGEATTVRSEAECEAIAHECPPRDGGE